MQKLGVNTQLMAAADIYPALERGVIDATEFSMPTMDLALGFHQIAKNNYYPGWHQQVSVSELLMNKAEWDKLSEQHKRIIQVALNDAVIHTYVETEAKNPPVMQEMKDKHKVTNRRWSDDDLRTFEKAWLEVLAEESAKDPLFKKVADHYLNWRKTYQIWGDAQELKSTYQKNSALVGGGPALGVQPGPLRLTRGSRPASAARARCSGSRCRAAARRPAAPRTGTCRGRRRSWSRRAARCPSCRTGWRRRAGVMNAVCRFTATSVPNHAIRYWLLPRWAEKSYFAMIGANTGSTIRQISIHSKGKPSRKTRTMTKASISHPVSMPNFVSIPIIRSSPPSTRNT